MYGTLFSLLLATSSMSNGFQDDGLGGYGGYGTYGSYALPGTYSSGA